MATNFAVLSFMLLSVSTHVFAQENIETNVAKSIQECYNNTDLLEANMKMPMSMNVLINLIRKVENGPSPMDLKVLSVNLLQRFRQDGIRKAVGVRSVVALPYSPTGHENDKFKNLLQYLVPGNALQFPNETLTPLERCTMHLMFSESVEPRERGDESLVCGKLEKYTLRVPRSAQEIHPDVEVVDQKALESANAEKKGDIQLNPNKDVDIIPVSRNLAPNNNPLSTCPLEYGVVYTKWGAISAGNLIAGIAAGAEPQTLNVKDIFGAERDYLLDNVWGATLAGDLAEAGYLARGNNEELKVGTDGGWPSTLVPHGYYLSQNNDYYITDAEIRGGLDGLILGTKMKEYRNSVRSMKLSQLLDMYYSERGVFGTEIRSCGRKELFKEYAKTDDMKSQALSYGIILHKTVKVQLSLNEDGVREATDYVVNMLDTYVPSLRDAMCLNDKEYQTTSTDILIFLDCNWQYEVIYPAVSYLLDNLHINQFNSNYTVINANNGQVIVNSSYSLVEFHENLNETVYKQQSQGFDLTVVVREAELLSRRKMDQDRSGNEIASRSLIALFVPHITSIEDRKKQYVITRIENIIRTQIPDLKFLVLTSGAKENFQNIVTDSSRDVHQLSESSDGNTIMSSVAPLINRINEVPRRITNVKCGSNWEESGSEKQLLQYIEPKGINYYRIHPNYFFGDESRRVKIRGQGNSVLRVCHSRDTMLPRANGVNNSSESDTASVMCKQITNDEYTIELDEPCSGKSTINECSPLYISVEAPQKNTRFDSCTEKGCRFPDNLKFTVTLDNFGCYSSATSVFVNIFAVISLLCIIYVRNAVSH